MDVKSRKLKNQIYILSISILLLIGFFIRSTYSIQTISKATENDNNRISSNSNFAKSNTPIKFYRNENIETYSTSKNILNDITNQTDFIDKKNRQKEKVRFILSSYGSPLADKADYLVESSYNHGLDYRLVAAISIVESGGGKKTCNSYNAWGWGGQRCYKFNSWEEGIDTVSQNLKYWYIDKGAVSPKHISRTYNADMPEIWAYQVQHIMNQMYTD